MRTLIFLTLVLAPGVAPAADWLQCTQTELTKPDCTAVSVNHVPLHFTASCQECTGGGSDIKCTPGYVATAATLAVDDAATSTPVAGTITQANTCAFQVPLWKFSGALVQGKTYNIVINVPGHKKTLLLAFTAGQSSGPASDIGVPPSGDGGKNDTGGGGNVDGASASGDGGGSGTGDGGGTSGGGGGGTDDGCSCRLADEPPAKGVFLFLLLLPFIVRRQRRK